MDIDNIQNLPNVFLRGISEIIIMTNLKLHTFLKHAGCPRGEGGCQIRTMMDKGEKRGKKPNILPDVLCECSFFPFFTKSPLPLVAKIFDPLHFFPYIFSEIFSQTFLIFFQAFKNCSGLPKFFTDLPKIFPRPTKNVIFLATFHKFLQFCLSNSDVSTTFGHFSQKSPLCWCGSYTHGSQRLMVSTEIIKNWGGQNGGQKIIWGGGICPPPPLAPPPGAATVCLIA